MLARILATRVVLLKLTWSELESKYPKYVDEVRIELSNRGISTEEVK